MGGEGGDVAGGRGWFGLCRSFLSLSYRFWLFLSFFSNNDRVDSQHRRLPLPLRSGTSTREDS